VQGDHCSMQKNSLWKNSGAVETYGTLQYQVSRKTHVWWSTSSLWLVADDSSNARSDFRAERECAGEMNNDRIAVVAKNDPLVVKFGESLYEKHGHHDHLHGFISNKLIEVARFLLSVRECKSKVAHVWRSA